MSETGRICTLACFNPKPQISVFHCFVDFLLEEGRLEVFR